MKLWTPTLNAMVCGAFTFAFMKFWTCEGDLKQSAEEALISLILPAIAVIFVLGVKIVLRWLS